MTDAPVTRRGDTIVLGDDQIRIEEGPVRKTATATAELLHDDVTASHYYEGKKPMSFNKPDGGTFTVQAQGRDALGKLIEVGKPMTYLDHGGNVEPGSRCFYIYAKRPVDPTKEFFDNDTANPHYVPEHVRDGALLADDGTPPNRTHYTYIFEEIDTRPTEEEAVARGQELFAQMGSTADA